MTPDILVIDDDDAERELIVRSLEECPGRPDVQVVRDGADALDFLLGRGAQAERANGPLPRVVLLDLKLARVSGLEVLRQLRLDARTRFVPVVVLTSSNLPTDIARSYQSGANSYVQKPVDFGRFRDVVKRIGSYWFGTNEASPPPIPEGNDER